MNMTTEPTAPTIKAAGQIRAVIKLKASTAGLCIRSRSAPEVAGFWATRIEDDVQDDEENKTEHRCQEEEHELPCGSPGVDECKNEGNRRKEGQQYAGWIIVNTYSGGSNCQQATDR